MQIFMDNYFHKCSRRSKKKKKKKNMAVTITTAQGLHCIIVTYTSIWTIYTVDNVNSFNCLVPKQDFCSG